MDRIGNAGGAPLQALPDGQQGFIDENLAAGQEGTNVTAAWLNALQETLMDPITKTGQVPNLADFTQLTAAIASYAGSDFHVFGAVGLNQFVFPKGWTGYQAIVLGGGAGGGAGNGGAGSGGAAGGAVWGVSSCVAGSTVQIYVGAGGAPSQNGGSSSINALNGVLAATGGTAGNAGTPGQSTLGNFGGAGSGLNAFTITGATGGSSFVTQAGDTLSGPGAGTLFGSGAPSVTHNSPGLPAVVAGSGGSGGTLNNPGGAGANGIVLLLKG